MTGHDIDTRRPSPAPSTPGVGAEPVLPAGNQPIEIARLFEERFHEIFRTTSAGMVLGAPDGSFVEVNPAFCRFLGYTAEELLEHAFGFGEGPRLDGEVRQVVFPHAVDDEMCEMGNTAFGQVRHGSIILTPRFPSASLSKACPESIEGVERVIGQSPFFARSSA